MKCELCQRLYSNIYTCTQNLFNESFENCCCCLDWFYGHCYCWSFDCYYIDDKCCSNNDCCTKFDEDYKKNETFCYCYKYTGKLSWFFNVLSGEYQFLILVISFVHLILQFITIGLIKKINNDINNKVFFSSNYHFLTYFFTFILYLLFTHIVSYILYSVDSGFDEDDEDVLNSKVFGVNVAVWVMGSAIFSIFFNLFFSIIFTILHLFTNITFIYNNNIVLIPIIINKLFYFTQSKICSQIIGGYKTFELLSNSTTLSIYILF